MFGLNLTSDLRKEFGLSLREALGSALAVGGGLGALTARMAGPSGRGLLIAGSLAAGVVGGLVPGILRAHVHALADAASVSRTDDRFQKLKSVRPQDCKSLRAAAQANAALQPRMDMLEKRLAKVEKASVDANATGPSLPPLAQWPRSRKAKRKPARTDRAGIRANRRALAGKRSAEADYHPECTRPVQRATAARGSRGQANRRPRSDPAQGQAPSA